MIKNTSGQAIGGQLVSATTGAAYVGTVTVYVTIDAGTQQIGSVGGGVCTAEGNGYYTYRPSQAETNGDLLAFTFIGSGAVPATIQIATITIAQQANLAAPTPGATSTTARVIITAALQLLGVFQSGETLPATDAADGLAVLQRMLGLWRLMPGLSVYNVRETFAITAGKGSTTNPYSVGPTGDFVTSRPIASAEVVGCGLLLNNSSPVVEIPRALLTDDAYQAIQVKDLTNALFTAAYYNPTYASGLGTVNLWPVPDGSLPTTFVWYRNLPIVTFTSLDAVVYLPEGVNEPIVYNLARRLQGPYGQKLAPDDLDLAVTGLAWVKRMNQRMTDLPTDPALTQSQRGGYNILTGAGG